MNLLDVEEAASTVYSQTIQCASQVSQSVSTPASGLKLGLHPFRTVLGSPRLAHGWPDGQTARLKDKQSDEEHAPCRQRTDVRSLL